MMQKIVIKAKINSAGILSLNYPVGLDNADHDVEVTVEPVNEHFKSHEEWVAWVESMAGSLEGDIHRPDDLPFEERDQLW